MVTNLQVCEPDKDGIEGGEIVSRFSQMLNVDWLSDTS